MMVAIVSVSSVSCSSDDDGNGNSGESAQASSLTLSSTSISLLSAYGSNSTFTISTDGAWTASCSADWINLSSRSGQGSAQLTVTALSANTSAEDRTAEITVQAGSFSQIIIVEQKAGLVKAIITIGKDNMVVLTNSIAFEQNYSSEVSYYYMGYLKKSESAGWTDTKIVKTLMDNFEAKHPDEDDVFSIDELSANTSYYLCAVAFDSNGNQGPLTKIEFTTAKVVSNRPRVTFGSITYDNNRFYWDTYIGPYASQYYMLASTDLMAMIYILSADAMIAYRIQEDIKSNQLTPIVQSGSWRISRDSTEDNYFYCAAWAQGSTGVFANELDKQIGILESEAKRRINSQKESSEPCIKGYSKKDLMKIGTVICGK